MTWVTQVLQRFPARFSGWAVPPADDTADVRPVDTLILAPLPGALYAYVHPDQSAAATLCDRLIARNQPACAGQGRRDRLLCPEGCHAGVFRPINVRPCAA
jgi:hypothetical protein